MYKSHPKPQNVLKRAQELFAIENYEEALELLQEIVKGKRTSRVWQKDIHEPIMQLYLHACVRLKKSQLAKEGLYQYKALCQSVNIKSLEDVVREYLRLAKKFTLEAKEKSQQSVLDIDDLDSINSPESVLMSAVSSEDTQDRTNRTFLMPWLRFLWESYRHCMEVFKNHNKLERLYHDIAREAFQFCQEYDRKTEFRRLCDNLRYHLAQVQKYQGVAVTIDLTSEETLDYHTKTRLLQLDTAIAMDLWLEAFKAIDDFHSLLSYYKKPPRPQTIVDYYHKFALVCFQSQNMLYHAAALLRVYTITRDYKKSFSQDELANLSNVVLLAVLTIPIQSQEGWLTKYLDMMSMHTENQRRLCAVLSIPAPPTRQQLLMDMEKFGVVQHASKCVVDLYRSLQLSFAPLHIHDTVLKSVEEVKQQLQGSEGETTTELTKYIPLIQPVMVVTVLKQISEIYKLMKLERLQQILHSIDAGELQKLCLGAARSGQVQLSIDERAKCVVFGGALKMGAGGGPGVGGGDVVMAAGGGGGSVQWMESEEMREMVNEVATVLDKATHIVYPENYQQQRSRLRDSVCGMYLTYRQVEHDRMQERPERIEKRLEDIEREARAKEEEQVREQQKRDEELRVEEEQRLAREALMREEQRKKEELKKLEKNRLKEHLEGLKKSAGVGGGAGGNSILQDIQDDDLEDMNANDLLARRKEEIMKENRERVERIRKEEKKVDHWERALREVELSGMAEWIQQQMQMRKHQWDTSQHNKIEQMKEEVEKRRSMRAKCIMMVEDKEVFVERLHHNRQQLLQERVEKWEQSLAVEKERLLAARRNKRKQERRAQYFARQKREEERRAAEEEEAERRRVKDMEEAQARKQEEEEQMRLMEERRHAQEKDEMMRGSVGGGSMRGSERPAGGDRMDDRYRGDRMRSPPIRGSGAYQPPASSDRYRPPVGGRDGGDSMRRGGPPPSEDIRRGGGGGRDSEDRDRDLFRRRGGDDEFRRGGGGAEDNFRRARDEEFERGGPPRGDRERDRDRDEAYRPAPLRTRGDGGRDFGGDRDRERDSMRGGGGGMGREDRFRPAPDDFRRGAPPPRDSYERERDRDRDLGGFGGGRDMDSYRGGDRDRDERGGGGGPGRGRDERDRGGIERGGNFRGQEGSMRGGGGGVVDSGTTAPIRPFRPREEKKDRPPASDDGWTEVRKR